MEIDEGTERRIVIGLIASDNFISQIREIWDSSLMETSVAKHLANWCIEYYDSYGKAPFWDIEGIYYDKLRRGKIKEDLGEEIEEDILPDLSKDYISKGKLNVDALRDETKKYLRLQRVKAFEKELKSDISKGKADEAENKINNYSPLVEERSNEMELPSKQLESRLKQAFETSYEPVLKYPGALGELWNPNLVRGSLIGLMGKHKIGKTFVLLDMAMRGLRQGCRVAFFQAGDMTETQMLVRGATYLTKRPFMTHNTGAMWEPCKDCIWNQLDLCDKEERECDFGIFQSSKEDYSDYYNWLNLENLEEAYRAAPDYKPCHNCDAYGKNSWGAPFLRRKTVYDNLSFEEALNAYDKFFEENKTVFKLSTYSNGTLSVPQIDAKLKLWKKQDNFSADLILIDYSDLLVSNNYSEFRHKQNDVWASLRGLSQDWHNLVVTPTQADSDSFDSSTLKNKNFSEDRRKLDHATAVYGLNQDPKGLEKKLGLMRINEIAVRESYFDTVRQVTVLQNLRLGRPFLSSFWGSENY